MTYHIESKLRMPQLYFEKYNKVPVLFLKISILVLLHKPFLLLFSSITMTDDNISLVSAFSCLRPLKYILCFYGFWTTGTSYFHFFPIEIYIVRKMTILKQKFPLLLFFSRLQIYCPNFEKQEFQNFPRRSRKLFLIFKKNALSL